MSSLRYNTPLLWPDALGVNSSRTTLVDSETELSVDGRNHAPTIYERRAAHQDSFLDVVSHLAFPSVATPYQDQQIVNHIVAELKSEASEDVRFDNSAEILQSSQRHDLELNLHGAAYRSKKETSSTRQCVLNSYKPAAQVSERRKPFHACRVVKKAPTSGILQNGLIQERKQYSMFYCPPADGQPNGGSYTIFENVGRRRPNELSRPYVCPEGMCTQRYQWWRSLQHHLSSKHKLARRKADYPQFVNLRT